MCLIDCDYCREMPSAGRSGFMNLVEACLRHVEVGLCAGDLLLMEKELRYVAPEAEVISAQVEKGVYSSGDGSTTDSPTGGGWS